MSVLVLVACGGPSDGPAPGVKSDAEERHNVLLIIADDLGVDKMSIYQPEFNRLPPTPNLDSLAARGVRFDNAWSSPSCSPTRAAMLTGRYPRRTGVGRAFGTYEPDVLSYDERTLPEALAEVGYDSSAAGKWHLSSAEYDYETSPLLHGFSWHAGSIFNFSEPALNGANTTYFDWEKAVNGVLTRSSTYATIDTTNDAVDRIEQMSEPWLLWVAYNAPHHPLHTPPPHLFTQERSSSPTQRELFNLDVEALDTEIGRLLGAMSTEVAARTTVIFIGDNGTSGLITDVVGERRAKGTVHEGGIHVPFIVAGPVVAAPGTVSEALVGTLDVFATAAEIAGAEAGDVDAISLVPILADPTLPGPEVLYMEKFRPNGFGPYVNYSRALRDERYKVIHVQDVNGLDDWGFYDLQVDPWEDHNLVDVGLTVDEQHVFDNLHGRLEADFPSPL